MLYKGLLAYMKQETTDQLRVTNSQRQGRTKMYNATTNWLCTIAVEHRTKILQTMQLISGVKERNR